MGETMYRLWDAGQRHLAGLRYVPARTALEAAEAIAWREKDARSLARIYLPLLEARRQIRYQAAEGVIVICAPTHANDAHRSLRDFLREPAGTILFACSATSARKVAACLFAGNVQYESRRTGRWLEALLLLHRGNEICLTTPPDPHLAAGIPVSWTRDGTAAIARSTDDQLVVPLPPPGRYTEGPLHAVARESLIVGWEALALKWQRRHAPGKIGPWEELAWLRHALRVDPACEPVAMRLMSLAEGIERER